MTEKKRKIHVLGINSYKFEDLSFKLQNLFQETVSIAVPNSYFEEIKSWSENGLEKKKLFFSSNSNKELVNWLRSQKNDVILISRGDPLWFGIGRILLEIKITSVFWDLSQLRSSLLLLLEKYDFFFSEPCSLHDLIFSINEFGTATFSVSKNRFCNLKDRSSNL